jgi:thiamine monophosphate kinase
MRRPRASPRHITTKRDIGLLRISKEQLLAVSCDAAGGIGSKPHDLVKAHPRIVGKLTARVALMELLAIGADPLTLAATLCVEPKPTGKHAIQGILEEVRHAQLSNVQLVCSSEKNFKVDQTGIGVTAIGLVPPSKLRIGRCEPGDVIVAIGEPHVGEEVLAGERNRRLADTRDVCRIRKKAFVHEIIPVGSRGIFHETEMLAKESKLSLNLQDSGIDVRKSAGPATVILCAFAKHSLGQAEYLAAGKPFRVIGGLLGR